MKINKRGGKIVDNFPPFEMTTGFLIEKDFLYPARAAEAKERLRCVCRTMRVSGGANSRVVRALQGCFRQGYCGR
jgi:hypothetical protein